MFLEAASQGGDRAEPQALLTLSPRLRARTPWGQILGNGARWYWERPCLLVLLSSGQSGSRRGRTTETLVLSFRHGRGAIWAAAHEGSSLSMHRLPV